MESERASIVICCMVVYSDSGQDVRAGKMWVAWKRDGRSRTGEGEEGSMCMGCGRRNDATGAGRVQEEGTMRANH